MFKDEVQRRVDRLQYADAAGFAKAPSAIARRAPVSITLVLIGAASLQGCGDQPQTAMQRDVYDNRAKCVQDWGDEKKCEPTGDGRRGYWYGPAYTSGRGYAPGSADADSGRTVPKGSNAVGAQRVARSGFGSTASAHSSGS